MTDPEQNGSIKGDGYSSSPKSLEELDLELVSMSPGFLQAVLDGHGKEDQEFEGVRLSGDWDIEHGAAINFRITQLRSMPELQQWLVHAIVRRSDRQMVGIVGFHGAPGLHSLGAEVPDALEIGYNVFNPFRRQGYATCAAAALIQWAHSERGVNYFVAAINHENVASQKVAAKVGFRFFRDFDPNDPDREDIYVMRLGPVGPKVDPGVDA